MSSSAGSSDPDVPYERISLRDVDRQIGLPLHASSLERYALRSEPQFREPIIPTQNKVLIGRYAIKEGLQEIRFDAANEDDEEEDVEDNGQNVEGLHRYLEDMAAVYQSQLKHMDYLRTQLESLQHLWGGTKGSGKLEKMIESWIHRMDQAAERDVLITESFRKEMQVELENSERQRNEIQLQRLETYEKRMRDMSAELEIKDRKIKELRSEKKVLRTWIHSTYRTLIKFAGHDEAGSGLQICMKHILSSLGNPNDNDIINIHRHLMIFLQSYSDSQLGKTGRIGNIK